jgi:hypothetical protein
MDEMVCTIVCPRCSRPASIVSPNDDGTYTIEDYFRGIGVHTTDPVNWGKQTTQWRWRGDPAEPTATIADGACVVIGAQHAARELTCTKSKCKAKGYVLQNDLIEAIKEGVTRLPFTST